MTKKMNVFANVVAKSIKEYLPEEYASAEVKIEEVTKLNTSYPALIVRQEGCVVAPSIDLSQLFEMREEGMDFANMMQLAASLAMKRPGHMDLEGMSDYQKVKEKLFIRISDANDNGALMLQVPHQEIGGLAITYHILLDDDPETGEIGSVMISKEMIARYGVTSEQLHKDAVANSEKIMPAVVQPLEKIINEMMFGEKPESLPEELGAQLDEIDLLGEFMLVVSNKRKMFGAAALFYPGLLQDICSRTKKDLICLPSSVHEVILVPDNGRIPISDYQKLVREINAAEVKASDKLSDCVYRINYKTGKITLV